MYLESIWLNWASHTTHSLSYLFYNSTKIQTHLNPWVLWIAYNKYTGVTHCKIKVKVVLWQTGERISVTKLFKYNQLDVNNILVWKQKPIKREAEYSRCETCRLKNLSTFYRRSSCLVTQTLARKVNSKRLFISYITYISSLPYFI